jgi:hypothetical protein
MAVTREDGGRLNAFAKEPRMRFVEPGSAPEGLQGLLPYLLGGLLVVAMVAVAFGISGGA